MLSDEEWKAIKKVKYICDKWYDENLEIDVKWLESLLSLCEKQQKEIEELKKPKYVINCKTNEITKLTNDFVSKDKIKAKIKEYEKELNKLLQKEEWLEPHDTIKRNKYMHYIEFGQSLLEKE